MLSSRYSSSANGSTFCARGRFLASVPGAVRQTACRTGACELRGWNHINMCACRAARIWASVPANTYLIVSLLVPLLPFRTPSTYKYESTIPPVNENAEWRALVADHEFLFHVMNASLEAQDVLKAMGLELRPRSISRFPFQKIFD